MKKAHLLKVMPFVPATDEMVKKARESMCPREVQEYRDGKWIKEERTLPSIELFINGDVSESGILKFEIFRSSWLVINKRTPFVVLYIDKKKEEFVTAVFDVKQGKFSGWSTAMLHNLFAQIKDEDNWYSEKAGKILEKQGLSDLKGIDLFQLKVRHAESIAAQKRETAVWDEERSRIPKLTKSFEKWAHKYGPNERFLFYKAVSRKKTNGTCSFCGKTSLLIDKPKHNEKTVFPSCKSPVYAKAAGRVKTLETEYYVELIQHLKDDKDSIVVRRFHCYTKYRKGYLEPEYVMSEIVDDFMYPDGTFHSYHPGLYHGTYRWISAEYAEKMFMRSTGCHGYVTYNTGRMYGEPRYSDISTYMGNYHSYKNAAVLIRSGISKWRETGFIGDYGAMLYYENRYPVVEQLAKLGLYKIGLAIAESNSRYWSEKDRLCLDKNGEMELTKNLMLDKNRLKRLRGLDDSTRILRWLQMEKREDTVWEDQMIYDFASSEIEPYMITSVHGGRFSFQKVWNYLKKEMKKYHSYRSLGDTFMAWRDYFVMAKGNRYNVRSEKLAFPENLKEAHDSLITRMKTDEESVLADGISTNFPHVNARLKEMKKFQFESGEYCIVVPENILDIVREGNRLQHCIHKCDYYFDRIQRNESYIFFLRKKADPKQPWYTLEVEPSGTIRQKRTTGDEQNKDLEDAIPFLKKWQSFFKQQLTPEEVRFGIISDELRQELYGKLRERKEPIWHGKLKGQLLADVLEKDLMPA